MSGSEFLRLVRQKHPDTVRIILTGQASLEAAIQAINEGEVYRFLTKPCQPVELAFSIRHALQLKELATQSKRLLRKAQSQQTLLDRLEDTHPGITEIRTDENGAVIGDQDIDIEKLINEIRDELG